MLTIRKTGKALSLALVMTMFFSLFAVPAAAYDHEDCDECARFFFIIINDNGEMVLTSPMQVAECDCSNPYYEVFTADGPHKYTTKDHITKLVKYCTNCGWSYAYEGICIGGCGTFCTYAKFPY